jgi:hypothetical protein
MQRFALCSAMALAVAGSAVVSSASANTIGYWRFEEADGSTTTADVSSNNNTMTGINNAQVDDNVFGGLPDTIPQTGASNTKWGNMANDFDVDGGDGEAGGGFKAPDIGDYSVTDFTAETYARSGQSSFQHMVGQWSGSSDRGWRFAFNTSNNSLLMNYTTDGSTVTSFIASEANLNSGNTGSDIVLGTNRNLYFAVTVDVDATNGTSMTFYAQEYNNDGTAKTDLLSHTVTDSSITSGVFDSSGPLTLGASSDVSGNLTQGAELEGRLDEVRFSNAALDRSDLLAVPSPGALSTGLMLFAGVTALRRRRRLA